MNIEEFTRNNIPLCVCTLGLAIVGYLAYHAVRWIIDKCQQTEKIDHVAQERFRMDAPDGNITKEQKQHQAPFNIQVPDGKITKGQGEYIVFHNLPNGEKKEVDRDTYERVYTVLNDHTPAAIVKRNSETAMDECDRRDQTIKAKIKEIDPTLEAVFIPRTLYELIFIRKCIKEDLKHNGICDQLNRSNHTMNLEDFDGDQVKFDTWKTRREKRLREKKCWHLAYFTDAGDDSHAGVQDVAYRLNKAATKKLSPTPEGFTHLELRNHAESEIDFLKRYHQECSTAESVSSCTYPGPTTNFGYESTRGYVKSMGIRSDRDAEIVLNAVAMDCSKAAQRAFLVFRGADFQKDSPHPWNDESRSYSLSMGSSLFAGCLFDGGATAFHFMRDGKNAYGIPVPFDQLETSPFYIPPTNTVSQLFGDGEIFHVRTKAWKDFNVEDIGGMNCGANGRQRDHLRSELPKEEFIKQFYAYKNQAIQLKKAS